MNTIVFFKPLVIYIHLHSQGKITQKLTFSYQKCLYFSPFLNVSKRYKKRQKFIFVSFAFFICIAFLEYLHGQLIERFVTQGTAYFSSSHQFWQAVFGSFGWCWQTESNHIRPLKWFERMVFTVNLFIGIPSCIVMYIFFSVYRAHTIINCGLYSFYIPHFGRTFLFQKILCLCMVSTLKRFLIKSG